MTVIGPGIPLAALEHHHGQATLTAPVSFTPGAADTYEAVPGTWTDTVNCTHFTTSAAGLVTYTGPSGTPFLFTGVSDLSLGSPDTLTYALYLNGVLVSTAETPHTFDAAAKTENIAITALIELNTNDTLQVWAKTLTQKQINVSTLRITIWG